MSENDLQILLLSQKDLEELGLTSQLSLVVEDVKNAIVAHAQGIAISDKIAVAPDRETIFKICGTDAEVKKKYADEELDVKLSSLIGITPEIGAIKLVGANVLNRERNLPRSESLLVIYDAKTYRPKCIMMATEISALRTGANSALVGEFFLSSEKGNIVTIVGAGKMAETSLMCMTATISAKIKEIRIVSKYYDEVERFVTKFKEQAENKFDLKAYDNLKDAVKDADLVVTVTTTLNPVVYDKMLKKDVIVLQLGGDEVAEDFLIRAAQNEGIYCDDWELVKHRNAASLPMRYHEMIEEGIMSHPLLNAKITNLGDAILENSFKNKGGIYINCVGLPVLDQQVGSRMYKEALKKGIGYKFSFYKGRIS